MQKKINELCEQLIKKLCSVCPNEEKTNCQADKENNCKTIVQVKAIQSLVAVIVAERDKYIDDLVSFKELLDE